MELSNNGGGGTGIDTVPFNQINFLNELNDLKFEINNEI